MSDISSDSETDISSDSETDISSDSETESSHSETGSSHSETSWLEAGSEVTTRDQNPLAGFPFDKLPPELLLEIFKNAYPDNVYGGDRLRQRFVYPADLAQVCSRWRALALGECSLWKNIYLMDSKDEYEMGAATRAYLGRSGKLPLSLTWFSTGYQTRFGVIKRFITSCAKRLQRITVISSCEEVLGKFATMMGSLSFPILQDFEISYTTGWLIVPIVPSFKLCLEAPHLRQFKLDYIPSFQLPMMNLVVFDYESTVWDRWSLDLNPLLELLQNVAHSLEHLRFQTNASNAFVDTPNRPRISLTKLKSLIIQNSHILMRYLLTSDLTFLNVSFSKSHSTDGKEVAKMFNNFSAPGLRSILFRRVPLLPLLTQHNIPLMFPQLEFCAVIKCDASAFMPLLEPLEQKKTPFSQEVSEQSKKPQQVENPFPKLKELIIPGETSLTALQATMEKRLRNGGKSLQKIYLWEGTAQDTCIIVRYLGQQGIDLTLYDHGDWWDSMAAPPAFQDNFFEEEMFFFECIKEDEYVRYYKD